MLTELLNQFAQQEMAKPRRPKEKHWPSDAGKCLRALVYLWRGTEGKKPDNRTFFVFEDGHLHHQTIRNQLRRAGLEFTMEEAPISDPKIPLSGKLDAVIRLGGKYYVLEIKSINRFSFEEVTHQGPIPSHVIQLQLYLHYVQNLFRLNTQSGILLYKCKDTSRFWESLIEYDETQVKTFFDTVAEVKEHLGKNTLPPRPYRVTDWECQYCDYSEICWEGMEKELENRLKEIREEELVKLIGELIFVRDQKKQVEKEEKRLTELIKSIMVQKEIKSGKIGSYFVELKEQSRKNLDRELLIEKLGDLEPFYKVDTYSTLQIKEKDL
ncbi:MAG: PD-(D/E)XK nuclease family protein [Candidatus Edwardsbacteria bacterium]